MHHGQQAIKQLLIALLLVFASSVAAGLTLSVSTEDDFQQALVDDNVGTIVVEADITFSRQNWQGFYSREKPYVLKRNLTITSFPPFRKIDFYFTGDGRVQLAAGVMLNISSMILEHARYGAGVQLDILAHSPGSYLVLWNSIMLRMACVSSKGEPDAVAVQPRLPGFPGTQKARYVDGFCLRKVCYDNVLLYEDFTKVTFTSTEDTAAGGYSIVMRNFSKVCLQFLEDKCLGPIDTADECVQAVLDKVSAIPTPRQQAAADAADGTRKIASLAVGVTVGCGGGMLLLGSVLLLMHRARQRSQQQQREIKLMLSGLSISTHGSTPDPEIGLVPVVRRAESFLAGPATAFVVASTTPPTTHNSWELAACKTSQRFLHSQPTDQTWSSAAVSSGWYLKTSGGAGGLASTNNNSSHAAAMSDLITGSSAADSKITLGVLLGAGSFGRVYKGKWRGMDVAVKVLQHSQAAAVNVANEVDLMMSFQHPNVVSAYHFVSWKKRRAKLLNGGPGVNADAEHHSQSGDALQLPDVELSDAALADFAGPTGDSQYPEDTQTWIVQEFCGAGNLCDYCIIRGERRSGQLPEGHAMLRLLFRLREVADGLSYLHSKAVVHGDLKSGNVLLSVAPTSPYGRVAKITDFGLSRALATGETHRSTHTLGTVSHMAPELLRFGKMSASVDVFSYGIMMWELLTGRAAFTGLHYGAIIERVALMGERPEIPEDAPEDYVLLMCSCWSADPHDRPSFDQVIKCLDIMITCRQQELAEAKSGSSLAAAATAGMSGSSAIDSQQAQPQLHQAAAYHNSSSCGEFDLVINSRGHCSNKSLQVPQQQQQQQPVCSGEQLAAAAPAGSASAPASGSRQPAPASDPWTAGPYGAQDL